MTVPSIYCVEFGKHGTERTGCPVPERHRPPPVSNITIRGNRISRPQTDAMFLTNFRNVVIEDNEITGVVENGAHNDTMQTVWGGDGLVFRHNYIHDNDGQGFFIDDGRVTNVVVSDNLFLRVPPNFWQIHIFNVIGAVGLEGNTLWDVGAPVILREQENRGIVVRNNVFEQMQVESGGEAYYRDALQFSDEYENVIDGRWS